MRLFIAALLLSISTSAWADNIAGCEVVLMEEIKQEDSEGVTEIASFRPAADFLASAYDKDADILREIDGLPIRAVMCKRKSIIPIEADFPIVATGTPFMISQNFDSTKTGLTTLYFKDGEFRSNYKGPELSENKKTELTERLKDFNARPHQLAEKEKNMVEKSTEQKMSADDTSPESDDKNGAPVNEKMKVISPEEHEALK